MFSTDDDIEVVKEMLFRANIEFIQDKGYLDIDIEGGFLSFEFTKEGGLHDIFFTENCDDEEEEE